MNTHTAIAPRRWAPRLADRRAATGATCPVPAPAGMGEAAFCVLSQAFQHTGGLVAADQLAEMMRPVSAQPISQLARWIVARQIVSVQWRSRTLLPLFQFGAGHVSLRPGLQATLAELSDVFDDWELASWFARGNSSLGGAAPADRLADHPVNVWQAARTDRFIATGA